MRRDGGSPRTLWQRPDEEFEDRRRGEGPLSVDGRQLVEASPDRSTLDLSHMLRPDEEVFPAYLGEEAGPAALGMAIFSPYDLLMGEVPEPDRGLRLDRPLR